METKYITRNEIAEELDLTVAQVGEAIARKIIVTDKLENRVPRVWWNSANLTRHDVLLQLESRKYLNTGLFRGQIIGFFIAAAMFGMLVPSIVEAAQ